MSRDTRFLLLSAGTIAFIQLSCIIEEWIFKSLPDFHYFWFVALVELALFTLFGGMAQKGNQHGQSLMPSARSLRRGKAPRALALFRPSLKYQ